MQSIKTEEQHKDSLKERLYKIVFHADTPAGKAFDVILLFAIIGSLITVMIETVPELKEEHKKLFLFAEWFFTALFTIEYILRIIIARDKKKYIFSYFGLIDLISTMPYYLALIFTGGQFFVVVRSLRLLRVFRVLKMARFLGEANQLSKALKDSREKITVFIIAVLCVVFISGTAMYMIEGAEHGFTSIPISIYWCIVTLTTVGYGDISPETPLGQLLASVIMILGYGVIAVPTGIVTANFAKQNQDEQKSCPNCSKLISNSSDRFCGKCGHDTKK